MVKKKTRKHKTTKRRCRTALEIEEEQSRTLYIRLPKTIKDVDEVKSLFLGGDVTIKLPRQSSRHCHVIFPSKEDKAKNLKEIKQKLINGKPVFAAPPKPMKLEKKVHHKKIKIPDPSKEPAVSKYLFISNIAPGVKASEIRDAFPGSVTVGLLKGLVKGTRQAKVKMSSTNFCVQYVKNKSAWPVFQGKRVTVSHSKAKSKPRKKKITESLKIYDEDSKEKVTEEPTDKKEEEKSSGSEQNSESENSDEEQSDAKDEVDSSEAEEEQEGENSEEESSE